MHTLPSFKLKFSLGFITSCYVILSLSMAMDIFMITWQDVTKPRENCNLKLPILSNHLQEKKLRNLWFSAAFICFQNYKILKYYISKTRINVYQLLLLLFFFFFVCFLFFALFCFVCFFFICFGLFWFVLFCFVLFCFVLFFFFCYTWLKIIW